MFDKLLIANRGEIACRILRTAKRLQIKTVAVYSTADQHALHVQLADEAYCIGDPPSIDSYLCIDKIIAVAKACCAQAIHPGYGFLSENAAFAQACAEADLCFVGPPPHALLIMGAKHTAKQCVSAAGVPVLPGYHGEEQDPLYLQQAADSIGYPVLLKATAGGGGKGMRIVRDPSEFAAALASAKREAQSSFGDSAMLVEKYLENPRHIELQIFADTQGNVIHLFERDCSLQRRQQKIIEEAPAPGLDDVLREAMGQAAIAAAKAVAYTGAGTIEFLLDAAHNFYFMEMNTRLQVEHPVTEMITGLDLVEWQLRVAAGEPLPTQHASRHGHAFEARIYAEDPAQDFLPCTGRITYLRIPTTDAYTRVDSGIQQNDVVTPYYDPLLAKLICWGDDRAQALARLQHALADYRIIGVTTNVNFLQRICQLNAFRNAQIHTHFVTQHAAALRATTALPLPVVAATCVYLLKQNTSNEHASPWHDNDAWQMNVTAQRDIHLIYQGERLSLSVMYQPTQYQAHWQARTLSFSGIVHENQIQITLEQVKYQAEIYRQQDTLHVFYAQQHYVVQYDNPHTLSIDTSVAGTAPLIAPMYGTVTALFVQAEQSVSKGQPLLVIEAMKMEHTLYAPSDGDITELPFAVGDMVSEGVAVIGFSPRES